MSLQRTAESRPARRQSPHVAALAVLVIGLVVTTALAVTTAGLYHRNEQRLLELRTRDAGAAVSDALPGIQTPLASAATLASVSGGDVRQFVQFVSTDVGKGRPFVDVSLWRVGAAGAVTRLAHAGPPSLRGASSVSSVRSTARTRQLTVAGHLAGSVRRLEYGYASRTVNGARYVVLAEAALPPTRRSAIGTTSPFAGLNYALYLGTRPLASKLLITGESHLPITGLHSSTVIPFGDSAFLLEMTPLVSLSGGFFESVPWLIAILGVLISVGAWLLTYRLVAGRLDAERIARELEVTAGENRRLYAEQRNVAETLQHALLPSDLPRFGEVSVAVRYVPGVAGIDIGGDWYDVIEVADRRFVVVVGDVSGRGLRAATVMAALRYAIRAYAAQGDEPEEIIWKLNRLLSVRSSGHFATVLCGLVDLDAQRVRIANAGHPNPLLLREEGAEFVETKIGTPIGVDGGYAYGMAELDFTPGSTLLAYTDGLIERRGEHLDVGLDRLFQGASSLRNEPLEGLLDGLLLSLTEGGIDDDTALLGVRWQN